MRILSVGNLYPPHSLGGYEVMWQSWVRHARREGHEVGVLASDFRLPAVDSPEDSQVWRDLRWYWRDHRFPRYAPWTRLRIERHNAMVLDARLAELRPDAVVWWSMAGMSTSLIERVRRGGIPAVAVLADYWIEYGPRADAWMKMFQGWRRPLGALAERVTGEVATVDMGASFTAVFASDRVRRGAAKVSSSFADAEVVYHGPDTTIFKPRPTRAWNWRLLCLGRIDPQKGTDLPIRALEHLPREASLRIVGGGNEDFRTELRELTERLGLSGRVSFEQRSHAETAAAYEEADVVLFPVRWAEPWGLVPTEAMAVGRPVIASGRGGSGEYLRDGINCLIFNPDNGAAELADKIRELAEDVSMRERIVEDGFRTVEGMTQPDFDERVQATVARVAGADPVPE